MTPPERLDRSGPRSVRPGPAVPAMAQLTSPIKLVCFDLGGVLIRICRSWAEACSRAAIALPPGLADLTDPVIAVRLGALNHDHEVGLISAQEFDGRVAALIGAEPAQVEAAAAAWLQGPMPARRTC